MKIFEIDPENEMAAVILEIKTGFEQEYLSLQNLIVYIESGKNPCLNKNLLNNIKDLETRLIRFLSSRLVSKTDPDRPKLKSILKHVSLIIKKFN